MDPDRYKRIAEVFRDANARPSDERAAFLDEACRDDPDLRAEVERLLTADAALPSSTTVRRDDRAGGAPWTAPDDDLVDTRIGPYRITHELGRGGMGVVYVAVREGGGFQRRAAIKVLKRGLDTEDVLRRFALERQVLGAMNHAGIARLYDAGETDDGRPYFVMEYITGLPIDEYCDTRRLGIDERLAIFRKVCAAVHYAHQNLVVHRDLKPGNIIVTEDGEPKLLDFGIAKLVNPGLTPGVDDPTSPELRIMTPAYASPEQVRGHPISTATDVYALGVILYELVCGHRPYHIGSRIQAEIERVICEEDPERPSTAVTRVETLEEEQPATTASPTTITPDRVSKTRETRPDRLRRRLTGDIDNIVLMAMRKEPQRRYPSAEQLGEDLRRHLDGLPVQARPDTYGYRVSKFVARNRVGVVAATTIVLLLAGGVVATTWQWRRAETALVAEATARTEAQEQRAIAVTERDRAERRFLQVRELGKAFVSVHNLIRRLDGALPATEFLVTHALVYLEALRKDAGDDPGLLGEIAVLYDRVGSMQGGIRGQSRGDPAAAMKSYREAVALLRILVAKTPDDLDLQLALANSVMHVGDMQKRTADITGAFESYQEAADIRQAALLIDPGDEETKREYSKSLINLADVLLHLGDGAGALDRFERAAELRRDLVSRGPEGATERRDLALALGRVAFVHSDFGEHEKALRLYRESLALRAALAAESPTSNTRRRDLMNAERRVAEALRELGRLEEALQTVDGVLATARRGLEDNPEDARGRLDLTVALTDRGQLSAALERWTEAIRDHREAITVIIPLVETYPEGTQYARFRADALEHLAVAQAGAGDLAVGLESAARALEIRRDLVERDAASAEFRRGLLSALSVLGRLRLEAREPEPARAVLEESAALAETLLEDEPVGTPFRRLCAEILRDLATACARTEATGDAVAAAEAALVRLDGDDDAAADAMRELIQADLAGYRAR